MKADMALAFAIVGYRLVQTVEGKLLVSGEILSSHFC